MSRLLSLLACLVPAAVAAQDLHLLDCYDLSAFGPGCGQIASPPPSWESLTPGLPDRPPLFTRETMAPTTPPEVLDYLNDITPENADAVIRFEMQRWQEIQRGQRLLKERAQLMKGGK